MAAIVEVVRPSEGDVWKVAVDGRCIVAFYGVGAQQLAEYHRDALEELLAAEVEESRHGAPGGADPASATNALGEPTGFWARSIFPPTIN
jgi:hypothetical protein